ncbi:hypothetical protein PC9H_009964 [Pleurotus ostreatus]|uniref:SH3 domain-containing protein n=1 Tax=Pleurotus ostreatus TaxID=5322 RepID=A0A8H6ZQN0_PLEOS|nr:uncharacterized protein PC9H_009964 [Pleurotus ostreatus]KAF7424654.1 hypothetical protein PC9H_009964 [Pleurotus ostreatus]KAJ8692368.1 hypothetical protein PTI98_009686 [Pleurotus ostreatus]
MPAFVTISIRKRSYENTSFSPLSIVGLILAGLVLLTVVVAVAVRFVRRRNIAKRESRIGAAFLDVKGLMVEEMTTKTCSEKEISPFSRSYLTQSIILPSKAYTRSSPTSPQPYPSDLHVPLPTAHHCGPFGFALDARGARRGSRSSFFSTNSVGSGFRFSMTSLFSTGDANSNPNRASTMPPIPTDTRKVHQPFNDPVLPDELQIPHPGERLTILHSYDDGWCAVGRKQFPGFTGTRKSVFGGRDAKGGDMYPELEVGVVPAWCFMKPVQGVRVLRPVRGSSLAMVDAKQHDGDRDGVMSWSHFS